ncbi:MAG TPA: MBL fold metallo-hydrolase [Fibrobacteria bacterium]|nr:MBL fold metallo-hydrolase [Fibrobacteria bacterium]
MEDPKTSLDIDAETLRKWLDEGRPVTVLDVRPVAQRSEWTIPDSVHADVYDAIKAGDTEAVRRLKVPEGIPVVAVCGLGRTSRKVADILAQSGIQAFSLSGGMQAWSLAWNVAKIPLTLPDAELIQVRRVGKGCLSYVLLSQGEAAVIDPSLDPSVYLALAEKRGAAIKVALDTHVHADHFSRSRTLAEKAGISSQDLREGESLSLGTIRLQVLETPGHTPESKSYVLNGHAVFTGDTLFLDSVGRPDLIAGLDPKQQSELLYESIQRLAGLPGSIWVLPAHVPVAPAFDGKPLAATLGELKGRNKYLSASKEDFMALLSSGGNAPPPNFETIVAANRSGILPEGDWAPLEAGPNRCARA